MKRSMTNESFTIWKSRSECASAGSACGHIGQDAREPSLTIYLNRLVRETVPEKMAERTQTLHFMTKCHEMSDA